MTALLAVAAGVAGLGAGALLNRAAGAFPWQQRRLGPPAVRPPLLELATAALFAVVAVRFGLAWTLPAFLFLTAVGVLLAVIDLRHRLLPNRVVLPSLLVAAVLLLVPAAVEPDWADLGRAALGAVALYVVFWVLRFVSPRGLGGGDVKLAALLGLYLGWLGWGAVIVGAAAGFAVQAVLALVLLLTRRIGLRGELPFGPAMLAGAAVAIGWADAVVRGYLGTTGRV